MFEPKKCSLENLKMSLDVILSRELDDCKMAVYSHYSAGNKPTLFTDIVKGSEIHIYINLQTISSFIEKNEWEYIKSIWFCAWFISNYINLLVDFRDKRAVQSFCDGCIFCNVIDHCTSHKKVDIYAPYICDRIGKPAKRMQIIDVLCDVNTLLKAKVLLGNELPEADKNDMDMILNERMLYLKSPEIIYLGAKSPCLTLKEVIREIRTMGRRRAAGGYELPYLPRKNDKQIVDNLIESYGKNQEQFWIELLLRMMLCAPGIMKYIEKKEVLTTLYELIEKQEEALAADCDAYAASDSRYLTDNFHVALKYVRRGKKLLAKAGITEIHQKTIHMNR
jgi:hypothetical protein